MTTDDSTTNDRAMFSALLLSLHAAGMQQLGKLMNPLTGEVERNLEQARGTINMFEMLERKTEGNLDEEEKKLLVRLLYELRMNYVDEAKKPEEKAGTAESEQSKTSDPEDPTES
jgi:hypothetical protein